MQGERDEDLMELRFIGGSPIEVYVFVRDFGDIDVSDICAITGSTCLIVYQVNNKEWDIQESATFIETFIENFEWDGDKICYSASNRGTFLEIKIKGFGKGKR